MSEVPLYFYLHSHSPSRPSSMRLDGQRTTHERTKDNPSRTTHGRTKDSPSGQPMNGPQDSQQSPHPPMGLPLPPTGGGVQPFTSPSPHTACEHLLLEDSFTLWLRADTASVHPPPHSIALLTHAPAHVSGSDLREHHARSVPRISERNVAFRAT